MAEKSEVRKVSTFEFGGWNVECRERNGSYIVEYWGPDFPRRWITTRGFHLAKVKFVAAVDWVKTQYVEVGCEDCDMILGSGTVGEVMSDTRTVLCKTCERDRANERGELF